MLYLKLALNYKLYKKIFSVFRFSFFNLLAVKFSHILSIN